MTVEELFVFNDLQYFKSSDQSVASEFNKHFGARTDGISLNDETRFNGVQPPITKQYHRPCYMKVGDFKVTRHGIAKPTEMTFATEYATNSGNTQTIIQVTVSGSYKRKTTTEWSWSLGGKLAAKFKWKIFEELGGEFSGEYTNGKSEEESKEVTISSFARVTVPARSRVKVSLVGLLSTETLTFEAPVTVDGWFGANFPNPVQGHYLWFLSANQVLTEASGQLVGTINSAIAEHLSAHVGSAEPL